MQVELKQMHNQIISEGFIRKLGKPLKSLLGDKQLLDICYNNDNPQKKWLYSKMFCKNLYFMLTSYYFAILYLIFFLFSFFLIFCNNINLSINWFDQVFIAAFGFIFICTSKQMMMSGHEAWLSFKYLIKLKL